MSAFEMLSDDEKEAMRVTGSLANLVRRIIGDGPTSEHDWAEAAQEIHHLQHRIMAQAAARAYPDEYRLMGASFKNPARVEVSQTHQEPT